MCPTKTGFSLSKGSDEFLFSFFWADKILKSIIHVNCASAIIRATWSPLFPVLHYLRVNLFTPAVAMATSNGGWNQITPCLSCAVTLSLLVVASLATAPGRCLWEAVQPWCCTDKPPREAVLTSQPLTTGGWETGQGICFFVPQVINSDSGAAGLPMGSGCARPQDQLKTLCALPLSWQIALRQALTLVP